MKVKFLTATTSGAVNAKIENGKTSVSFTVTVTFQIDSGTIPSEDSLHNYIYSKTLPTTKIENDSVVYCLNQIDVIAKQWLKDTFGVNNVIE